MSEIASLLRLQVQVDKEIVVTPVTVTPVATAFESQLTTGYTRKQFYAYNNSSTDSGELYYGHDDTLTVDIGRPIPLGADVSLNVNSGLDVYFIAASGELGDLRVFEGA